MGKVSFNTSVKMRVTFTALPKVSNIGLFTALFARVVINFLKTCLVQRMFRMFRFIIFIYWSTLKYWSFLRIWSRIHNGKLRFLCSGNCLRLICLSVSIPWILLKFILYYHSGRVISLRYKYHKKRRIWLWTWWVLLSASCKWMFCKK